MLEYYEVDPLPEVCRHCIEAAGEDDCYNCDYALDRWHLTPESEERLQELKMIRREATSHKDYVFDTSIIRHVDVVWIQPNALSHKQYYRIIDTARQYKRPVRYFLSASAQKSAAQIVECDNILT